MQEKLEIITTTDELNDLIKEVEKAKYVAYDIETTSVHRDAHIIGLSVCISKNKAYYIVTAKYNVTKRDDNGIGVEGTLEQTELFNKVQDFVIKLKEKKLLMHNAVFDCRVTNDTYDVELMPSVHTDTMVLTHLLDENSPKGLKDLGVKLFGENADVEQKEMLESARKNGGKFNKSKKIYEMYKADWKLIAKYGAKDALLTYKLFLKLVPQLKEENLVDYFYQESMPLLRGPTYEMNTKGLQLDMEELDQLNQSLTKECAQLEAEILEEIHPYVKDKYPGTSDKNTFNIGSPQQKAWLLFIRLGNTFKTLTDKGRDIAHSLMGEVPYGNAISKKKRLIQLMIEAGEKPERYIQCNDSIMQDFAGKYNWVSKLLEFQKKKKMLNTYAESFKKNSRYGIIYPSFNQCGTTSGRYSSSNPNFQNIPRRDRELAARIRKVIVPRDNCVFVGADYSQVEPRILASFSQDKALMECFEKNQDFYAVVGVPVYKVEASLYKGVEDSFEKLFPIFRDNTKTLVLANNYGQTINKLSKALTNENGEHYTLEEAQVLIDNYFEAYPGVEKFILETHEEVKNNGVVYNMYGRPRRIPDAKIIKFFGNKKHGELAYKYRTLLNLAVNFKIQGTAASIMNRAAIKFYNTVREKNIDATIVMQVHDELIVEVKENQAKECAKILQESMESAAELPGVPLKAEPSIGKNLAELK